MMLFKLPKVIATAEGNGRQCALHYRQRQSHQLRREPHLAALVYSPRGEIAVECQRPIDGRILVQANAGTVCNR